MDLNYVLMCFLCVAFSFRKAFAEVAYLYDNNSDLETRDVHGGLPETLLFTLHSGDGDIALDLRANTHEAGGLFQLVNNGNRVKPEKVKNPDNARSVRFYQDHKNHAYFTAECVQTTEEPCRRTLKGNIVIGGKEYGMEPIEDHIDTRGLGDMFGYPHKLTKIQRRASDNTVLNGDYLLVPGFMDDEDVPEAEVELEHPYTREEDLADIEEDLRLQGQSDRESELLKLIAKSRDTRATKIQALGVELIVVLDYSVYKMFLDLYGESDALSRMYHYYCHIINGVDLMYASIQQKDLSIYVTVARIYYATSPENSPWTALQDREVDVFKAIVELRKWRQTQTYQADHMTLITANPMKLNVVGLAYLKGICTSYSVSVNQEMDFFQTAATIAHELGHSLGARHDEDRNACASEKMNIMTPYVTHVKINSQNKEPWLFSSCSIYDFTRTITRYKTRRDCLLKQDIIEDSNAWTQHVNSLPGILYTLNQQCQLSHGPQSYHCTPDYAGTKAICRGLGCRNRKTGDCPLYVAAHGTPCGAKKHCFEGVCIEKEDINEEEVDTNLINDLNVKVSYVCMDRGIGKLPCDKIFLHINEKSEFCASSFYDCCLTCSQFCSRDSRTDCDHLINRYGPAFTCRALPGPCCHTCSNA